MATKKKLLQAAAGSAGGAALNVEDVFSTYLYTGTGSNQTITNSIDLSGEGGMVWIKHRNGTASHTIHDTERGATYRLITNDTAAQFADTDEVTSFNSDGFTVGSDGQTGFSGRDYASWTFRKAPKFFDVVTYTGNGTAGRTVSHNLGSVPACIIVKATNNARSWAVYHRGTDSTAPEDYGLYLDLTSARANDATLWNDTAPTSTEFTVGTSGDTNVSGRTYVAYLFAHNDGDGEFGPDGDQDIIKCGVASYPTSGDVEVNLGFEPQWVLLKDANHSGNNWWIIDTMRGWEAQKSGGTLSSTTGGKWQALFANLSNAETSYDYGGLTPTGFKLPSNNNYGDGNTNYIYIAIRRGPMAEPESATDVFDVNLNSWADSSGLINSSITPDTWITTRRTATGYGFYVMPRITGGKFLETWTTDAEGASAASFDLHDGVVDELLYSSSTTNLLNYFWKRAPNYFDVVAYTGNGTAGHTINHNLGVAPEMIWVKARSSGSENWNVYHKDLGNTYNIFLNKTFAAVSDPASNYWNSTNPTDANFTLGTYSGTNQNNTTYIAYLFASLDGISKVGSYTGNGTSQNIECGFSTGARFILIKRTDTTQNWYVFDSERGIVAGNDPYLRLNQTAQEYSADYVDPYSAGFAVTGSNVGINASGGSYIFYAIA